ncbi:Transposase for transposon Tn5 [Legionella pneumophila]|nr:Transposase for transposon Tn5 [Legionella pneumophila]CZI92840.1 Transposase for transposon Tn5 [Legionella pneumophila]
MQDAENWIIEETKLADFGDKRLNKRYGDILNSFSASPTKSIPSSFKSWKETLAAYRFFNHENVSPEEILASHRRATVDRIKNEKIVLILQDTTEIDFSGRKPISGMGYLSNKNSHGFYLHPSLVVTPERNCLGVIDSQNIVRNTIGQKTKSRRDIPIQEKESYCWLKGYEAANAVALEALETLVISIADREGDIYELLEKASYEGNKAQWLIRMQYDRPTLNEIGESTGLRLREIVSRSNPLGEIEFSLPAGKIYNSNAWQRKPRETRIVRQEIRAQTVYLKPPHHKKNLKSVAVHIVHCREINPPSEEEKIEWFLLTSVPIRNSEESAKVVKWYLCRW